MKEVETKPVLPAGRSASICRYWRGWNKAQPTESCPPLQWEAETCSRKWRLIWKYTVFIDVALLLGYAKLDKGWQCGWISSFDTGRSERLTWHRSSWSSYSKNKSTAPVYTIGQNHGASWNPTPRDLESTSMTVTSLLSSCQVTIYTTIQLFSWCLFQMLSLWQRLSQQSQAYAVPTSWHGWHDLFPAFPRRSRHLSSRPSAPRHLVRFESRGDSCLDLYDSAARQLVKNFVPRQCGSAGWNVRKQGFGIASRILLGKKVASSSAHTPGALATQVEP